MATTVPGRPSPPAKARDIAEALAARLAADPRITSAEVAGPGFLNLRLAAAEWQSVIRAASTRRRLRPLDMGKGQGRRVRLGQPDRPDACRPVPGAIEHALASLLASCRQYVTREQELINDGGVARCAGAFRL